MLHLTVLCVVQCFWLMSNVTAALRACGVSAVLVIEEELWCGTGRPHFRLNTKQVELIEKWVKGSYRSPG